MRNEMKNKSKLTPLVIMKRWAIAISLMLLGGSMSACATGGSGTSWKEEVQLHGGSTIIVERSFSRGGLHEPGQGSPIKEQDLTFTVPGSSKTVTWQSDYSEDVGRSNFNLLALDMLNGTPYIVAEPNLCLSYNKWGRPNPPYVTFKYDGAAWQRIPLTELPAEIRQPNVAIVVDDADLFREIDKHAVVSAATIKKLNGRLTQPEYKTILREAYPNTAGSCGEMVYDGNGGWIGIGWFRKQPTYEACLNYCGQEKIPAQYCPCTTLFKGEK
jgi:hypothetical protein